MKDIVKLFTNETVTDISPLGNGHINSTFCVSLMSSTGAVKKLVLQKINNYVFTEIDGLMDNISRVTQYLKANLKDKENADRAVLTVIQSINGKNYEVVNGEYYRCFLMIEDTVTYNKIKDPQDFYKCAEAFAGFARDLADFPAETLYETIKNFHDTEVRYADFINALETDAFDRAKNIPAEIEFCIQRKPLASAIVEKLREGIIPLRVVHNDTKLNNILFDKNTNHPLCIIDLDTVMPGAACCDFGDSIRSGSSQTDEDEHNLEKVYMSMELYEAYVAGYMSVAKDFLTTAEIESFIIAPLVITYELSLRFLADYLMGDVYFKINYPDQNLRRFQKHMKLLEDMEKKLPEMEKIIRKYTDKSLCI